MRQSVEDNKVGGEGTQARGSDDEPRRKETRRERRTNSDDEGTRE